MHELLRRLHYLLNRRRLDAELAQDLEVHREMAMQHGGRPLGSTLRLREEAREAWGWTWIDRAGQDLRYAVRLLRRSPGFTLAAVAMLALGIGVNVAAFGFLNLVVLKPLPVRDPASLLRFQRRAPDRYATEVPYAELAFFREHSRTLSAILASHATRVALDDGGTPPIRATFVTANFFDELGAVPRLGRVFDPRRDEARDAPPVVVLSHGFWQRRFGSDPLVLGRTLRLNGVQTTIVGVAPHEFSGLSLEHPDAWVPIEQHPTIVRGSRLLTDFALGGSTVKMWGRMRAGLTPQAVEAELRALAAELRMQRPDDIWKDERLTTEPGGYVKTGGGSHYGTGTEPPDKMTMLFVMVGSLVLLILAVACGNLGSLLLARGVAREREIAIRLAVGAGAPRLMRQLLTESMLLALLGSAAGLIVGYAALQGLLSVTEAPPWINPAPDWRVVSFAIAMGLLSAMLFGLAPAWHIVRQRHRATLMRQCLVGAQIAASCVLLIVAGLLVRAVDRLMFTHPGFDYQHVLSIDPALASHGYSAGRASAYLDALQSRLRAMPGVADVSLASTTPLGRRKAIIGARVDGRAVDIHLNRIDAQFFQTMGIPLLRGRNLTAGEKGVAIVSDSFVRAMWPGEDPLGKQFDNRTVIGVSGSARASALQDPDAVEAYFPIEPADLASLCVLVKTTGPPEDQVSAAAAIAKSIDPALFPETELMTSSFRRKLQEIELTAAAVTLLGVTALLLACLGIVGLVAYSVSQRTKEIGIRLALGATAAHVIAIVLRQFTRPVVAGLLAGVGGAAALSQLVRRELYGVSHLDPVAYAGVIGVFLVTVVLAALLPARRALRVDPLRALRHE